MEEEIPKSMIVILLSSPELNFVIITRQQWFGLVTDQHVSQFDVVVENTLSMNFAIRIEDRLLKFKGDVRVGFAPTDMVGRLHRNGDAASCRSVNSNDGWNADAHEGFEETLVSVEIEFIVECVQSIWVPDMPPWIKISGVVHNEIRCLHFGDVGQVQSKEGTFFEIGFTAIAT